MQELKAELTRLQAKRKGSPEELEFIETHLGAAQAEALEAESKSEAELVDFVMEVQP